MITQKDVKTLEKTLVTKKDLTILRRQLENVFATKRELKRLESNILDAIEAVGKMILKDTRTDLNEHDDALENHDRRILSLEDKVFS